MNLGYRGDNKKRIALLTEILLDKNEELGARDDAAMDLGSFADKSALNALIIVASDPQEEFIADVAGESIAMIWVNLNHFSLEDYNKLIPIARREVFDFIKGRKPEWINIFNLKR